ncbi:protein PHYTOCHROME KINASE SUBSTRATE 1-like [Silene latifolia]|uniref:protein PHYTOCHROME KINASE SUBSTRATE 1-like n=1 Tax=Silene latifolia TaxID=37657 RepID=UPI003D774B7B
MAMTTYSNSTYKANEDGGSHRPRDASFSSYLDSNERDFVRNLAASVHIQSPARESSVTPRACLGRTRFTRPELGVFGADRYFNEKLDDQKCPIPRKNRGVKSKNNRYSREKTIDLLEKKSTLSTITSCTTTSSVKSLTPSYKSEGSWNSQFGTKILNGLQCKGTCIDKESLDTIDTQDIKVQSPRSHKGDNNKVQSPRLHKGDDMYRESKVSHQEHFAFPIVQSPCNNIEDQPRKSLEIFGFRHIGKQDIAQSLERKLSILTWDAIPNSQNGQFTFPFPSTKKKTNEHNDARSEASSDLFEIEHLSGIPASQSSYATSEASIEWSVVTASAAEFSVVSEYRVDEKMDKKMANMEKIKVQKSSSTIGGGLLGCRNHKSVDVVRSINTSANNKKI